MKFAVRIRYFDFPNLKYVDEQIVLFNSFREASLFATLRRPSLGGFFFPDAGVALSPRFLQFLPVNRASNFFRPLASIVPT